MSEKRFIKSSAAIAAATLSSRVLGLFRAMLEARVLGGGVLMTAWGLALTIPNLFRRLFGEGAVGAAVIPIIRGKLEEHGVRETRGAVTAIISALSVVLAALCLFLAGGAILLAPHIQEERYRLFLLTTAVTAPYALFICLAGVGGAILNTLGRFFLPALTTLAFNLALIAGLWFICPLYTANAEALLRSLAIVLVASGAVQLLLILSLLRMEKMLPIPRLPNIRDSETLRELWRLTLPGIISASALQISLLCDRFIASFIGDKAVPALMFSERIVYLPVGIFAVSAATVAMSGMSRHFSRGEMDDFQAAAGFGVRQLLFLCVPTAVFCFIFGREIIELLYRGGRFDATDSAETLYALRCYAVGIPAFATVKIMAGAFNSRRQVTITMRAGICCVIVNLCLNLVLMWPLRQGGIAIATVCSALLNNLILAHYLRGDFPGLRLGVPACLARNLAAAGIAAAAVAGGFSLFLPNGMDGMDWIWKAALMMMAAGTFSVISGLTAALLGAKEPKVLLSSLISRRNRL